MNIAFALQGLVLFRACREKPRRRLAGMLGNRLLAAAGTSLLLVGAAGAYPTKPVRLVAGNAPGAATDTVARIFATKLSEVMGQQFIVDNRPGAGFEVTVWYGLCGPARLPGTVIATLLAGIGKTLAAPDLRRRFAAQGVEPRPVGESDFDAFFKNEVVRWAKVVKDAGIAPE